MTIEIHTINYEVKLRTANWELPNSFLKKQTQFPEQLNEHKLLFNKLL